MLLLVYHYMPNGSLDAHIFCPLEKAALGWNLRYKILSNVSLALHYLHNEYDQKVLHRDLKASNIMLDGEFNARLGDFGLARAIDNGKTSYVELDGVPGTFGYIAPECLHTSKASRESDVYGFGAMILEREAQDSGDRSNPVRLGAAATVPPFKPPFVWPSMGPLNIDGDTTDTTPITSSAFGSGWTQRESFARYSDSSFA
ncbi:hypothetical protein CRG98_047506 [Punica granatum]|nr:hypothetical protein CRG98_047506 [Punica granatum]